MLPELPEIGDTTYRGREELDAAFASVRLSEVIHSPVRLAEVAMKLARQCESPIEVMLGAELIIAAGDRYRVVPQFKLSSYRYDFAVMGTARVPLVLVECDGAAFHSTERQLANDRAKDAAATAAGTRVIRIQGREINRNAKAWAAFVLKECSR